MNTTVQRRIRRIKGSLQALVTKAKAMWMIKTVSRPSKSSKESKRCAKSYLEGYQRQTTVSGRMRLALMKKSLKSTLALALGRTSGRSSFKRSKRNLRNKI